MSIIFSADKDIFDGDNFDLDNDDSGENNGDNTIQESTGRWTREEHLAFVRGLELHGKGWKKIASLIKTRTVVQIRTHAQKYFLKLSKSRQSGESNGISIDGKPLGPNRKKNKRRSDRPIALAQPILSFVKKPTAPGETLDIDDGLYNFLSPRLMPIAGSSNIFYQDPMLSGSLSGSNSATPLPIHSDGDHELMGQSGANLLQSSSAHSLDTMFYVDNNKPEWFQRGHNVDQLLKDAEGLNWLQDCGSLLPIDNILPVDKKNNRSSSTLADGIAFQHPNNSTMYDKTQMMMSSRSSIAAGGQSNTKSLTHEYPLTAANLTSLNSGSSGSNDFNIHFDASDMHMLHQQLHSDSVGKIHNTGMRFDGDSLTPNDYAWASLGLEQLMATSADPSTSNGRTTASNSTSACLSAHSSSLNIAALDCKDLDGYEDDKSSDYNHESTSSEASSRKYITKPTLTTLNAHNSTIKPPRESESDAHRKNHDDKSVSDTSGCTTAEEVGSTSHRKRKNSSVVISSVVSKSPETAAGRRSSRFNAQ